MSNDGQCGMRRHACAFALMVLYNVTYAVIKIFIWKMIAR